jgi:hypothetical protein
MIAFKASYVSDSSLEMTESSLGISELLGCDIVIRNSQCTITSYDATNFRNACKIIRKKNDVKFISSFKNYNYLYELSSHQAASVSDNIVTNHRKFINRHVALFSEHPDVSEKYKLEYVDGWFTWCTDDQEKMREFDKLCTTHKLFAVTCEYCFKYTLTMDD